MNLAISWQSVKIPRKLLSDPRVKNKFSVRLRGASLLSVLEVISLKCSLILISMQGTGSNVLGPGLWRLDLLLNSPLSSSCALERRSWAQLAGHGVLHHSVCAMGQDETWRRGWRLSVCSSPDHLTELRETGLGQHCQVFQRRGNTPTLMSSFPWGSGTAVWFRIHEWIRTDSRLFHSVWKHLQG